MQFGGIALRCYPLTWAQNGICLAIGAGGIIWGLLIKLIIRPDAFEDIKMDETPMTTEERKQTNVMNLRKSSSSKRSGSSNSILEKSKSTQALTNLIRHRSTILREAGQNQDNYQPLATDDSTPAMNKLVAMLRKEDPPQFGKINESNKPLQDDQVAAAIE